MALTSGDYNRKVIFKGVTKALNEEGGTESSLSGVTIPTWANVASINQQRVLELGAEMLIDAKKFTVRFSSEKEAITKDWLLYYEANNYNILSIVRNEWEIILIAKRKTDG